MIFLKKNKPINNVTGNYESCYDVKNQINANYYGIDACKWRTIEEMGELAQALGKDHRLEIGQPLRDSGFNKDKSINHIAEEIADVSICLDQLTYILNCESFVKFIRKNKIDRTYNAVSDEMKWFKDQMDNATKGKNVINLPENK